MQNRTVTLAVVIGLLVGAAGVGVLVVADDDGPTSVDAGLPKLPIGAYGERTAAAAASMLAGPVEWRVRGQLPDLPDDATAYRVEPPSEAAKQRLLTALGDVPVGVQPDGSWNAPADNTGVADCAPSSPEATPDTPVSCANAASAVAIACDPNGTCPEPVPPTTPADLPSREEAQRIALGTLEAAGIDTTGNVEIFGPGDAWEVSAEPRLGGRRVFGLSNNLSIGSKGAVVRGGGLLLATTELGEYPLVSTTKGLERLEAQWGGGPGVLRGGAEPAIAVAPGEPYPDTRPVVRTITGVTLGLQPSFGARTQYLVPAFLFETDDGGVVPVPAVVDALLEQPGTPEPVPAPGPPGQIEPAPPSDGGGSGGSTGSSEACSGASSSSVSSGGETNEPMKLEVCARPSRAKVGETVTFTMTASDPDAAIDTNGCQQPLAGYGDEGEGTVQCMALCRREDFPPEATTLTKTFTHAYAEPGTYTARFSVGSCAPKASQASVELQITVRG